MRLNDVVVQLLRVRNKNSGAAPSPPLHFKDYSFD
jgi:hypothetical protein